MHKGLLSPRLLIFAPLMVLLLMAVACGADATPAPVVIEKEVIKEVVITVVATPTPAPTPAVMEAKVAVLIFAIDPVSTESNTPWVLPSDTANLQLRPVMEPFIDIDAFTAKRIPGLAVELEMITPDAKNWRVKIRQGVQFHDGWGELTAEDLPHTLALMTNGNASANDTTLWIDKLGGPGEIVGNTIETELWDNTKVVDKYTVELNFLEPTANLEFIFTAGLGATFAMSKAYFTAEGLEGYEKRPIGTGPWKFVDREPGQFMEFERVENHYRKTPDFKGFKYIWQREPSTRMAALLAGEVHMATLPRDLYGEPLARGMVVMESVVPAIENVASLGGFYRPESPYFKPGIPFLDIRVREAVNRAINRDEIIAEIYKGQAETLIVQGYHPTLPGWNPQWAEMFEEKYGYDPERARELIAEAGYAPGEIKVTAIISDLPVSPEMGDVGEAIAIYLRDVGMDVEELDIEFGKYLADLRGGNIHMDITNLPAAYLPPDANITVFNLSIDLGGRIPFSETKFIDDKMTELKSTVPLDERAQILREMGDHKFEQYVEIPLVWMKGQLVVDPSIVKATHFPGGLNGLYTHMEYAEAVSK